MTEVRRRHATRSKLNESEITLAEVTPPATVMIRNLPSDISRDVLELYFSNRRRSDGGQVVDVTLDDEDQHALVTFADYKGFISNKKIFFVEIFFSSRCSSSHQTRTFDTWTSS